MTEREILIELISKQDSYDVGAWGLLTIQSHNATKRYWVEYEPGCSLFPPDKWVKNFDRPEEAVDCFLREQDLIEKYFTEQSEQERLLRGQPQVVLPGPQVSEP